MIRLVIFDMDGTVFESHLDWVKIREDLDINAKGNILKEIYRDGSIDQARLAKLERYEDGNTLITKPIKGIVDFLSFLKCRVISTALVTNNSQKNTEFLLDKFTLSFDMVITRERRLWKPSPDPFLYVMEQFSCDRHETISIGDSRYDVQAANEAGIKNIYIIRNEKAILPENTDHIVFFRDFIELKEMLVF
ncbi:MAG: HAD family hydrolase [Candidatus Aminicenantes bacterium]|nr:HAD family hydrolase [Candidatus Aminicenantes bacterium]